MKYQVEKKPLRNHEHEETAYQKKEMLWRLTAPVHVTVSSFRQHQRLEGYQEYKGYQNIFKCDRLLKLETVFGRIQMGYNPNKRRSFLFAHMKTNRYDTVSRREEKGMKEYQQYKELRKEENTHAYIAGRRKNAAVLLEKEEYKPWSEQVLEPYFKRKNMEAILKTMPFFHAEQERQELAQTREMLRSLQTQVRENNALGKHGENAALHRRILQANKEAELLQGILYRKDAGCRGFLRKLNYAFDIEKRAMFDYYREQREKAYKEENTAISYDDHTEEDSLKEGRPAVPGT